MTIERIYESALIDSDANNVWNIVRDFTSTKDWADEIVAAEMENGEPSDKVGGIRTMTFDFGAVVRERLNALDDRARTLEYELLPPEQLPLKGYIGRITVVPVTASEQSVMIWESTFSVTEGEPSAMADQLKQAYQDGMKGIENLLKSA